MSLSERTERARREYVGSRPSISCLRAAIWTESHKETEGEPMAIRRAKAFAAACEKLPALIFPGELIVGTAGEHRRSAILTPEFSWTWVDREMDTFDERPQDPYLMTEAQRAFARNEIWPYWKGKSLEEAFLKRVPPDTAKLLVDTGILDSDSKWRQAVGEITPDYQDILFPNGFRKLMEEAKEKRAALRADSLADIEKMEFYDSAIIACAGTMRLAERYSETARTLAAKEKDVTRRDELIEIASVCARVPAEPPRSFREACQFVWFVQLCGIISENPLALNPGRFDQYMYPFYSADLEAGLLTREGAKELVECLWLKLSEWVWTISSNTAKYFAGYNQFQNLTLGGRRRDGRDGTNELSYICLEATEALKTHQPGLSVRIHPDCPDEFLMAVVRLIRTGTGFPAVHNDLAGTQMLLQAGYEPEDARDWNNCGCVVPHFRKTGEWTSAVNVNFGAALEYALNSGKSRMSGELLGLPEKPPEAFADFREVKDAFLGQLAYLVSQAVIGTVVAQRLHMEMVPRPFLSICVDGCMEKGKDLSRGGARYNVGPVLTGIGLGVVANSLAAIKRLVFDDGTTTLKELAEALEANWEGFDALRDKALAVPKYGNDDDYVDAIATEISDFYYRETRKHRDVFDSPFNSAFMGISNYVPTGKIVGALPCGRMAGAPLTEGVSPFAGSDVSTPLAVMRSAAKINHDVHTGGTLLNLRLNRELLATDRGLRNLGAMIRSFFSLGAFHVQFNTVSTEELRKAQAHPEEYRDLLVRVAGYSTQFVNLSREMQEAIIARTEHGSF
ncbi:MAG: glycyl radical protein [Rectinemataceae bacterium]